MPAYATVYPSKCLLPCALSALESPASLAACVVSVQHHPAPVRFEGGMCCGDAVQVLGSSATSPGLPCAEGAFPAPLSRENTPLVQRRQNKTRRLTESPCSSDSGFTIMGAGLACEETKVGCHQAERQTQPFAVHCLSHAMPPWTLWARQEGAMQERLCSCLSSRYPIALGWSRATHIIWASISPSGLVCPEHPMALAAGKETGRTGNSQLWARISPAPNLI